MDQPAARIESSLLAELALHIDAALRCELEALPLNEALREAMTYAVLGGGKRLRPALVLLSAKACGGRDADSLPAAIAIELIHCFSLVHDDLPALDDDDLRRGRPTLHVHRDEATALLAGDALMAESFAVLARSPLKAETVCALTGELSAATLHMISGQMEDTVGGLPEDLSPREQLERIHAGKTGALIRAACRMGAISAVADDRTIEHLGHFGASLGLLFQMVDDLIDETQSSDHAGKRTGKDRARGRPSWPGLLGAEATHTAITKMADHAEECLESVRPKGPSPAADAALASLRQLVRDMASRTR